MITGNESIASIFNIFHDGSIEEPSLKGNSLEFIVEIPYLANRINPAYNIFKMRLHNIRDMQFEPWTKEKKFLTSFEDIFWGDPGILGAEVNENFIRATLSQGSKKAGYSGGFLKFMADSAEVFDESGKSCSLELLDKICGEYWAEWENKSKKPEKSD